MSEKGLRLDQVAGGKYMLPNLLANPGFEIWQRGVGPFTTSTEFAADEWMLTGVDASASRNASPKFGTYCAEASGLTTGANLRQGVESYKSVEGLYLTFSAWVKTSDSGVYIVIYDYDGSAVASTLVYHSGGGAWEKLTTTKLIRTGLTTGGGFPHDFGLMVLLACGSGETFQADGASLVAAEVPFPEGLAYAPLNVAEDLQRCQRFYAKGKARAGYYGKSTGALYVLDGYASLPCDMYATPTVSGSTWTVYEDGASVNVQASYTKGVFYYADRLLEANVEKAAAGQRPSVIAVDWTTEVT